MRNITENGLDLIKHFEGFSNTVYICPAGKKTIGYGHMLKPGESFPDGISEEEAEELLRQDVAWAERAVLNMVNVPLKDGQFDALVSFVFNNGGGAFQKSTLLRKINNGQHAEAPKEFRRWVYAGKKKLQGLERRREAEVKLYELS
mmetsp:Transcript_29863/g.68910  ORF Transcript_29863/g.68910 Transcript_29863/m.68910 type:complete len:146 (+) Transcript_29863:189-626(+)